MFPFSKHTSIFWELNNNTSMTWCCFWLTIIGSNRNFIRLRQLFRFFTKLRCFNHPIYLKNSIQWTGWKVLTKVIIAFRLNPKGPTLVQNLYHTRNIWFAHLVLPFHRRCAIQHHLLVPFSVCALTSLYQVVQIVSQILWKKTLHHQEKSFFRPS